MNLLIHVRFNGCHGWIIALAAYAASGDSHSTLSLCGRVRVATWSHTLMDASRVRTDSGEPGTSKTCSNCGYFDTSLGGSKVYNCPRCGICMDRDVNGWRGNLFAAYGKAVGVGWDGRGN